MNPGARICIPMPEALQRKKTPFAICRFVLLRDLMKLVISACAAIWTAGATRFVSAVRAPGSMTTQMMLLNFLKPVVFGSALNLLTDIVSLLEGQVARHLATAMI